MNDFIPASIANGLFDVSGLETRNPCGIAGIIGDKAAGDFKPFKGHYAHRIAASEGSLYLPDTAKEELEKKKNMGY